MTLTLLVSLPVLLVGAALALVLRSNRAAAAAAMLSQAAATMLVFANILPILRGGAPLEATWEWPAPIDLMTFRVDALDAFYLAWSLPMTLLGTFYAEGYLRPHFQRGRHGGPHFALLNLVAIER